MTQFCATHARDRTNAELKDRLLELDSRASLGPGLSKEAERIRLLLIQRGVRLP